MALVSSSMMQLGTIAPSFHLKNVLSNQQLSLENCLDNKAGIVIAFICNH
jgi:hypothetical protein